MRFTLFLILLLPVFAKPTFELPEAVDQLLGKYCYDCHDSETQKGEIQLDNLGELTQDLRLTMLTKLQEQTFFQEMPPRDKQRQPTEEERATMVQWATAELTKFEAEGLAEKLKRYSYGNYVDHHKLFSGEHKAKAAFTYDRRWLISEHIFNATMNRITDYQGRRTIDGTPQDVLGDNGVGLGTRFGGSGLRQNLVNPFLLPKTVGVQYYDNTQLNGGHLLTMLANAKKIAAYLSSQDTIQAQFPATAQFLAREFAHRDTMRRREAFLRDHIVRLASELFPDNDALLPPFVAESIEPPEQKLDRNGKVQLQTNLELLNRFDHSDMQAIYRGLNTHYAEERPYEEVIERCETEWFVYGVPAPRIRERVGIMQAIRINWDFPGILERAKKRASQPPAYVALPASEMSELATRLRKHRQKGDTYSALISRCMTAWQEDHEAAASQTAGATLLSAMIRELYIKIFERPPTTTEASEKVAVLEQYLTHLDEQAAAAKLIETLLLSTELVYRHEFGIGEADQHGRRMMSPRAASYAIAYALTDYSPDAELAKAAREGRLTTRADYRREVERLLKRRDVFTVIDESVQKMGFNSSITNQPVAKIRFFRDFFGYTKVMTLFKDDDRFGAGRYDNAKGRLVDELDMLVGHILETDRHVFEELLTTDKFYIYHSGDNDAMADASARIRRIYEYFKNLDWQNFTEEELYSHWDFINEVKMRGTVFPNFLQDEKRRKNWVGAFKRQMADISNRFAEGQTTAAPYNSSSMHFRHKGNASTRTGQQMRGPEVTTFFGFDHRTWEYPTTQPAPVANRKGILTHPAWLIAHSLNTETDPVRRGKWVREKLLAGTIPDVPITVDALIPEDHHKTLRQRLEKRTSTDSYCWKCHQRMDPLGLAFEMYDDFGRFRTEEAIEHPDNLVKASNRKDPLVNGVRLAQYKTLPVKSDGVLSGTGDPTLDGPVRDALELTDRLAKSTRVRQSIIRHAFRYFLGRNEMLSDAKTLIDAEQAYLQNNGSFDAVIVSLLTSDSFIYRKPVPAADETVAEQTSR